MSRVDEARALLAEMQATTRSVIAKGADAALLALVEGLEHHNGHLQGVIDGDANVLGLKDGALMVEHPLFALMGSIYARILDEHAAENYVETRMLHKDTAAEYIVTIRRHDGRTPHELRMEAERRVADLERRLAEATEWRPMEDAPRDGTRIICLDPSGKPGLFSYSGGVWWDAYQDRYGSDTLLGWLPLPAAPTDTEER